MPETQAAPIRPPDWYRITGHDWVPVTEAEADATIGEGGGLDLVHVDHDAEEVPLW